MIDCLVTGAGGALGSVLMRVLLEERRNAHGMLSTAGPAPDVGKFMRADLADPNGYRDRLFALDPRVILHVGAMSQIAAVYGDPDLARAVNVDGTVQLLAMAEALGARFVYVSTDLVFDGESAPYQENDTTEPVSLYGRTKLEAECHVLTYRRGLVVRLPLMYGFPEVQRRPTFFQSILASLRERRPIQLFEDEFRTPLWLDDAARACSRSAFSDLTGVVHAGGPERLSRLEMGQRIVAAVGGDERLLVARLRSDAPAPEPRARDVSLISARFAAQFREHPGRPMNEALRMAFLRGPSRLLS